MNLVKSYLHILFHLFLLVTKLPEGINYQAWEEGHNCICLYLFELSYVRVCVCACARVRVRVRVCVCARQC